MRTPWMLRAYLVLTWLVAPIAPMLLNRRLRRGKEDPKRVNEKLGHTTLIRPDGPLVWFHAVGVGEVLTLPTLMKEIYRNNPEINFLVTSSAKSAAQVFENQTIPNTRHQYLPLDTPKAVKNFLDHWQPDLSVWLDQEIWPRLVHETAKRKIPLALVNGRIGDESYERRRKGKNMFGALYRQFELIEVQDQNSKKNFELLGAAVNAVTGTLKQGADPLPDWPKERMDFEEQIGDRNLWLASSLHPEEANEIIQAHRAVVDRDASFLLVIAPRNVGDAEFFKIAAEEAGLTCQTYSSNPRVSPKSNIFIDDRLGHLGVWYRQSDCAFIGGSFCKVEGHNPFEAANLDCAIFFGPRTKNFEQSYDTLLRKGGAILVEDEKELAKAVLEADKLKLQIQAKKIVSEGRKQIVTTSQNLIGLMSQ